MSPELRIQNAGKGLSSKQCWLWPYAKSGDGYGHFKHKGADWKAHRFSYLNFVGKITYGMQVLHKCDTPLCVNPNHLFLGTAKDNVIDCVIKGRMRPLGRANYFINTGRTCRKRGCKGNAAVRRLCRKHYGAVYYREKMARE